MEIESFEVLVLKRPRTVLEQYLAIANSTREPWILVVDQDARIQSVPKQCKDDTEFLSFKWIDCPKIYTRCHFGIGLYRTSSLKKVLEPSLSSEGLDLVLEQRLKTEYSEEGRYTHNLKMTMKGFFRYGKGRAYFNRTCQTQRKIPEGKIYLRYWRFYLAYLLGFLSGYRGKVKDSNW